MDHSPVMTVPVKSRSNGMILDRHFMSGSGMVFKYGTLTGRVTTKGEPDG
jgi:hypothetical protein